MEPADTLLFVAQLQNHFLRLEREVAALKEAVTRLKAKVASQQRTFEQLHDVMQLDDSASESAENYLR